MNETSLVKCETQLLINKLLPLTTFGIRPARRTRHSGIRDIGLVVVEIQRSCALTNTHEIPLNFLFRSDESFEH